MRSLVLGFVLLSALTASSAFAATLNVVGGQLLGASEVIVDGSSYNVEFLDGTCIALYSGCDEASDFTFPSSAAALLASQALLDQVFLDGAELFDTDPALTAGCTIDLCLTLTPWAADLVNVQVSIRFNNDEEGGDVVTSGAVAVGDDFAGDGLFVYAVWSPVPEPGTAVLMGLGLLGLSVRKRRVG